MLVSRFLLDLQDAHLRSVVLDSRRPLSTVCLIDERTISFAQVAGSLGATIDYGTDDDSLEGFDRDEGLDSADWVMEDDYGDSVVGLKV